ncbi:polysaccharide deacetylase family protein [Gorillibacterium sp. sgz5001074]|uniref:polysaccharide deacetylase family protein n=1 Tax=Gorillibacterium sp. sgz5001074 TaxID=3446695 RepID=UPI003F67A52D
MPQDHHVRSRMVELLSVTLLPEACRLEVGVDLDGETIRCLMDIHPIYYKELEALQPKSGARVRLSPYMGWDPFRERTFGTMHRWTGERRELHYFACPSDFGDRLEQLIQEAAASKPDRPATWTGLRAHEVKLPEAPKKRKLWRWRLYDRRKPQLWRRRKPWMLRYAVVALLAALFVFRPEGRLFTDSVEAGGGPIMLAAGREQALPTAADAAGEAARTVGDAGLTASRAAPAAGPGEAAGSSPPASPAAAEPGATTTDAGAAVPSPAASGAASAAGPRFSAGPQTILAAAGRTEKVRTAEHAELIEITGDKSFYRVDKGYVALSFDDGPSVYTKKIVDLLVEGQAAASFLFVGKNAEHYPDAVTYTSSKGMPVGNHSWDHSKLTALSATERKENLERTNRLLEELTGQPVSLFRPPYGALDASVTETAQGLKLKLLLWNRDAEDWNAKSAADILRYFHQVDPSGGVYVLHEDKQTVEALPDIIRYLQELGLKFTVFQ